jgi:spore germination protein YaaH
MIAASVLMACTAPSSAGTMPSSTDTAPYGPAAGSAGTPGSGPDATHPWVMQQTQDGDITAAGSVQPLVASPPQTSRDLSLASFNRSDLLSVATRPKREVFAFAFGNSSLGDPIYGYPAWSFNLLSTIAYFGLSLAWDGTIVKSGSGWTTWNSSALTAMVSKAHANGVRVLLSINLHDFSASSTSTMCAALHPSHRAVTITQTIAQMQAKHMDGVNFDYEGTNTTCAYGATLQSEMTSVVAEMRAKLPSTYIAVDTYSGSAGESSGFFNIPDLAPYTDSFFVMAYDMEYSNYLYSPLNCPSLCLGPTAPLTAYHYNDTTSMSEYTAAAGASKVILGVPYYGRKECVANVTPTTAPPNARAISGSVASDGYLDASTENGYSLNTNYHGHRDVHDAAGYERWDTWTSASAHCTREMYWDDVDSLGRKYDLVNRDGLRGVGIFALQYGGGAPELWQLLRTKFLGCIGAGVTATPVSPQPPGAVIQFAATATGCSAPRYEFWLGYPNGTWVMKRAWGGAAWSWDSTGAPVGTYSIHVWANQSGDPTATWQTYAEQTFTLAVLPPCDTAGVSPSTASQAVGTSITFTATSTGCGTPAYEYWLQDPSGSWTVKRRFSTNPAWTWSSSGLVPGTYTVHVWANQYGDSEARWEAYGSSTVTLTGCTSASVTPSSPVVSPGTAVNFTATSVGCASPLYEYWIQYPNGTWYRKRGWGGPAYSWATTGLATGTYTVHVWANQQGGSMARWQAYGSTTVSIAVASLKPVTGSAAVGSAVTFTAASIGVPNPMYEFWLKDPSGVWRIVQAFGSSKTWRWNTAGRLKGTYTVHVWVNQHGSDSSRWQTYGSSTFRLT